MARGNKIPLKVSNKNGKTIFIYVKSFNGKVHITTNFIKEVAQDNPDFSDKGKIKITCEQSKYTEAKLKLTQYLETLFLKGLNDEDIHSSIRIDNDSQGNEAENTKGKIGTDTGKGNSTSLYTSTRRNKSTESTERKINTIKMDKGDNT